MSLVYPCMSNVTCELMHHHEMFHEFHDVFTMHHPTSTHDMNRVSGLPVLSNSSGLQGSKAHDVPKALLPKM